jgi:hypothetical protein
MLQEIKSHNSNVALKLNTNENVPSWIIESNRISSPNFKLWK